MILKSQNVDRGNSSNTRLVVFGNIKAQDGRHILSVLDLRPIENNLALFDMQKVSSSYTKDNNPKKFIENSIVVYADKKRTTKLLKSIGFQAPIELQQSGYIGSINYFKRSVNINGENFYDVFSANSLPQGVDSELSGDSNINYADYLNMVNPNLLVINRQSTDPLIVAAFHESVHYLKAADIDTYNSIVSDMKEYALKDKEYRNSHAEIVKNIEEKSYSDYMSGDAQIDADFIEEEFTSSALSYLFSDAKNVKKFAQENFNGFQRVVDNVIHVFEKNISMYEGRDKSVRDMYEPIIDKLKAQKKSIIQRYDDGISGTVNSDSIAYYKYDISQGFYTHFDKWVRSGMNNSNEKFIIGNTSEALKSINVKDQNIVLTSSTILNKLAIHKEMSVDIFRRIPELLENPMIVQFSDAIDPHTNMPKYDSRITVLGELYAEISDNGQTTKKPVLVSLELLPTNKTGTVILDFSLITSAYSKNSLQNYLNNNTILYINPDKKRTHKWLSLNGLQLPVGETKYGPVRSISYVGNKVKVKNSTNKSSFQIAFEKAGLVDNSGNVKHSLPQGTIPESSKNKLTVFFTEPETDMVFLIYLKMNFPVCYYLKKILMQGLEENLLLTTT